MTFSTSAQKPMSQKTVVRKAKLQCDDCGISKHNGKTFPFVMANLSQTSIRRKATIRPLCPNCYQIFNDMRRNRRRLKGLDQN
jgi:hypothetical protein